MESSCMLGKQSRANIVPLNWISTFQFIYGE
jgi:hypothetical protein